MKISKTKVLWIIVIIEFLVIAGGIFYQSFIEKQKPLVLVIDMYGELYSSAYPELYEGLYLEEMSKKELVSSTEIVKILKKCENDADIKAVILHIDMNGGDQVAQAELVEQIRLSKKPVVAVISGSALSSGYYVAAATGRIFANELSNVADIGVMMLTDYTDKNGHLRICQMSSSEYKKMYLDDCPGIDPRIYQQGTIDSYYKTRQMAMEIAAFRNLSEQHALNVADGLIFAGVGALKLGLIDEIGGIQEANEWLEKAVKTKLKIVYYGELSP
jgi:protease IV